MWIRDMLATILITGALYILLWVVLLHGNWLIELILFDWAIAFLVLGGYLSWRLIVWTLNRSY